MTQFCENYENDCAVKDLGSEKDERAYVAENLPDDGNGVRPIVDEEHDPNRHEIEVHQHKFEDPMEHRPPHEDSRESHHPPIPPHADLHELHHPPIPPHADPQGLHHPPIPPHADPHGPHYPPLSPHADPYRPRGPHPKPPRFDPDVVLRQAEDASTLELFDLCHRVLHRPDAGAMRGQSRVLAILAERGEMSQRELQEMLHIQPGSMSELIAKLERKGMLTRARGDDRRSNLLQIKDEGRKAAAMVEAPGDELFCALSEEQRKTFVATLKPLLADWICRDGSNAEDLPDLPE